MFKLKNIYKKEIINHFSNDSTNIKVDANTSTLVSNIWNKVQKNNDFLYDGKIYSLVKHEEVGNKFIIYTQKTNFKYLYVAKLRNDLKKKINVGGIGILAIIETSDNKLVLTERATDNMISLVSGVFNYENTYQTLEKCITDELLEELEIPIKEISTIYPVYLISHLEHSNEFIYYISLKCSSESLKSKNFNFEIKELMFIDKKYEIIDNFYNQFLNNLNPTVEFLFNELLAFNKGKSEVSFYD